MDVVAGKTAHAWLVEALERQAALAISVDVRYQAELNNTGYVRGWPTGVTYFDDAQESFSDTAKLNTGAAAV